MRRGLPALAVCAAFASFAIFAAVFRPVQLLVDINQAPTSERGDVPPSYVPHFTSAG